jgi:4-hydroxybenzoate polyprenyltransferase
MINFIYYYIRSMRLYCGFVTGAAVLAGCAASRWFGPAGFGWREATVLAIGYLAWGVNQIFNDAGNLREDAVNAPHRPMVNGKLAKIPALALSSGLMLVFGMVSCVLTPWTLLPIGAGAALNLLYSPLKGVPVLGCVVYGLAIVMGAVYGWIGGSGGLPPDQEWQILGIICLILLPSHVLMCHNSYFKDMDGDRAAGRKTLQTVCNPGISLWASGVLSVLYAFMLWDFVGMDTVQGRVVFAWLLVLTGWNLRNLVRRKYHAATCSNIQLCVAQNLCVAVYFSSQWLAAMAGAFLLIALVFRWYPDEKE